MTRTRLGVDVARQVAMSLTTEMDCLFCRPPRQRSSLLWRRFLNGCPCLSLLVSRLARALEVASGWSRRAASKLFVALLCQPPLDHHLARAEDLKEQQTPSFPKAGTSPLQYKWHEACSGRAFRQTGNGTTPTHSRPLTRQTFVYREEFGSENKVTGDAERNGSR